MHEPLARPHTFASLVRFALPNTIMMLFLSLYTIVDGIFVSRYAGTVALSAVNMVYPVISLQMAVGIMLATGGSAILAIRLGEGRTETARQGFSLLVLVSLLTGVACTILGLLFLDPSLRLLGVTPMQYQLCRDYIQILYFFAPAFFLQTAFQTFFVTAGKPVLGLAATVCAGVTNAVLDYVFVAVLGWGIAGAALATGIGYCLPAVVGLVYFSRCQTGSLFFVKPHWDGTMLFHTCTNGSSEMVTNLANAVTTYLFNYVFLTYFGEDGVASITIILYFQFVMTAIFFGYSTGVAPIISFKYGSGDTAQLKKIYHSSLLFLAMASVGSAVLSFLFLEPALRIFTQAGSAVYTLTKEGFPLFAVGFLISGISIFASAMFTALSDGKTSAIISFARTFIFLVGAILLLPRVFGEQGVWLSMPIAEALGVMVSILYLLKYRQRYQY